MNCVVGSIVTYVVGIFGICLVVFNVLVIVAAIVVINGIEAVVVIINPDVVASTEDFGVLLIIKVTK